MEKIDIEKIDIDEIDKIIDKAKGFVLFSDRGIICSISDKAMLCALFSNALHHLLKKEELTKEDVEKICELAVKTDDELDEEVKEINKKEKEFEREVLCNNIGDILSSMLDRMLKED